MVSAPVGRSATWQRLTARLAETGGSVILLAGEPGSGRSHLLRRFGQAAVAAGWREIGCLDPLGVEKTTKLADMSRVLGAQLETDGMQPAGQQVSGTESADPGREVFAMLERAAPVVVGVDGYTPSSVLDQWFAGELIPWIRAATRPTTLVITGQLGALAQLEPVATELIELGPLDRAEVVAHLSQLGAGLRPPLTEAELAGYYDAIATDARLLRGLNTVFRAVAGQGC